MNGQRTLPSLVLASGYLSAVFGVLRLAMQPSSPMANFSLGAFTSSSPYACLCAQNSPSLGHQSYGLESKLVASFLFLVKYFDVSNVPILYQLDDADKYLVPLPIFQKPNSH